MDTVDTMDTDTWTCVSIMIVTCIKQQLSNI